MATKYPSHDPYTFTRAAADEQRECTARYGVVFETVLRQSPQRGVWHLETRAFLKPEQGPVRQVAKQTDGWPEVQAMSFEAKLYQHTHKLVRMVEMVLDAELGASSVSV